MDHQEAKKLVLHCQAGELNEFAKLYDAFLDRIYKFVFYRVGHKELSEDITSTVFLKALQNIQKFNPDKGEFSTWLYTIAKNSVVDHFRSGATVELPLEEVESVDTVESPFEQAVRSMDAQKAQSILNALGEKERELIVMRLWDGLSHKEIAEILGQSEGSVRTSFSRVMSSLKLVYGPTAVFMFILLNPLSIQ